MAALQRHPQLYNHGAALLDDDEVENRAGTLNTGDEAEDAIVERMREPGRQALGQWAEQRHAAVQPAGASELRQVGKKTLLENDPQRSRFERTNLAERNGDAAAILRRRRVQPRGCSRRRQGALIDFGADHGCAKAAAKMQEHDGASEPASRARAVTRHHAHVRSKPRFRGGDEFGVQHAASRARAGEAGRAAGAYPAGPWCGADYVTVARRKPPKMGGLDRVVPVGVTVLELQKRCFSSCRKVACDGRSLVISNPPFLVVLPPPLSSRAPSHWLPWPLFPRGSQIRKIGLAEFSTLKIDLRGSCWLFRTMRDLFRWAAFFFVSLLVVRGESIYELSLRDIDGKVTSLAPFKGRVLLIVNVASECGYTAQYQGLESVFAKYQAKGLVVLGFPCNQFGGQEPGSNAEIKTFCSGTFHVTFPLFEKIEVNGAKRHPLYAALTGQGSPFPGNVRWNFNKFLVGRDGTILRRIDSDVEPDSPEMIKAIEAALAAKP